ncbi:MAG: GNAT family N-acetyltransferase [Pseudomonadota bacterium]
MSQHIEYRAHAPLNPEDVCALLRHTDWAGGRDLAGVTTMLRGSVGYVYARNDGVLIGFARAFGDGVYRAVIEDVVVHPDYRGAGVGHKLVTLLLQQLEAVEETILFCVPEREGFYRAHGFERHGVSAMSRRGREQAR